MNTQFLSRALALLLVVPSLAFASYSLKINVGIDPAHFGGSSGSSGLPTNSDDWSDWEAPEGEGALHPNGVTVTCLGMGDGEEFNLGGKTYRVVYDKASAKTYAAMACTSNLTDLSGVFGFNDTEFNEDVSHWDTANVTDMTSLAEGAEAFNQDLSYWNTSRVVSLDRAFMGAYSFNSDISRWDTSRVTSMYGAFWRAISFNQPIGSWDTSNVTDMSYLFAEAKMFNQNLPWNVSSVRDFSRTFYAADSFNGDVTRWDTGSARNMLNMFSDSASFNQNIGDWDVSSVTEFSGILWGATAFNQDLSSWCIDSAPPHAVYDFDTAWTPPFDFPKPERGSERCP